MRADSFAENYITPPGRPACGYWTPGPKPLTVPRGRQPAGGRGRETSAPLTPPLGRATFPTRPKNNQGDGYCKPRRISALASSGAHEAFWAGGHTPARRSPHRPNYERARRRFGPQTSRGRGQLTRENPRPAFGALPRAGWPTEGGGRTLTRGQLGGTGPPYGPCFGGPTSSEAESAVGEHPRPVSAKARNSGPEGAGCSKARREPIRVRGSPSPR